MILHFVCRLFLSVLLKVCGLCLRHLFSLSVDYVLNCLLFLVLPLEDYELCFIYLVFSFVPMEGYDMCFVCYFFS